MWTITDEQLDAIVESQRQWFRDLSFHVLYDKAIELNITENDLKNIISTQIILIEKFNIIELECSLRLIELAMQYSILNEEELPEEIETILNSDIPQYAKINSTETVLSRR